MAILTIPLYSGRSASPWEGCIHNELHSQKSLAKSRISVLTHSGFYQEYTTLYSSESPRVAKLSKPLALRKCSFSAAIQITILHPRAHACISASVAVPSILQQHPCGWLINTPGVEQSI